MPSFDLDTFSKLKGGTPGDLVQSVGSSFGVPDCMLDLASDLLALIPAGALMAFEYAAMQAQAQADNFIKKLINTIFFDLGIIGYDTETGQFTFMSKYANLARAGSVLDSIMGAVGAIVGAANALKNLYDNINNTIEQIKAIADCIEAFANMSKHGSAEAHETAGDAWDDIRMMKYGRDMKAAQNMRKFADRCQGFRDRVNQVLLDRLRDPSLEPRIGGLPEVDEGPIFRLVFGPPESTRGRFLLSVDGLYFDSQREDGVELALAELKDRSTHLNKGDRWRFEFDPNLGGKGVPIKSSDLTDYVGTIFDPEVIDDSPHIMEHYDADQFLSVLKEQRNKRISDIEQQIEELSNTEAGIAIIDNTKQSLISETSLMDNKVNRRRKQIEIAVKAPSIYGKGPRFSRGDIPINDFSYLKDLNIAVALSKQQRLVLSQEDVSGVVLPLKAEFVVASDNREFTTFDNLLVPEVGVGEVVYDTSNVSGTDATPYSITNTITEDGLFALYNFLNSEVVDTSSTEFLTNNSAKEWRWEGYNNCQIVSKETSTIFTKGLGIPFFEGITKHQASGFDATGIKYTQASAVGGYGRLADSAEFRDLMYDREGFTIDFWTHIPTLMDPEHGWTDNGVSSQHRLVLACDNVGIASGVSSQENVLRLAPDLGEDVVRGFVMGFTRDARMVSGSDPINKYTCTGTLDSSSNVGFYLATTQSRDSSSAGFISSSTGACASGIGWHKWFYNVTSVGPSGVKFKDVAKEYMNIALTVSPRDDQVKVYLDSNLMATSGINAVFGTRSYEPPKLPSSYRDNSFEYSSAVNVGPSAGIDLSSGPRLNPIFTPWIIGGGYTDGFASGGATGLATPSGNFMGGEYGGVRSGLRGHLGGMKFYRKPLSQEEIHKNFQAQQPFFKNIRTVNPLKGRLFFLLGGENAAGQADLSSIPDASGAYSTKKFENVYIWNPRTSPELARWDNLEAGYNNKGYDTSWGTQTKFGPELSMASALSVAYPNENIYIAKLAASGAYTATSTDGEYNGVARPSWSHLEVQTADVDASNCLFKMVLSSTVEDGYSEIQGLGVTSLAEPFLKARGNELLQVCGIFYVNGESDAGSVNNHALGYKGNIKNFVSRMRSDLASLSWVDSDTTAIPFVQTVIHKDGTGNTTASGHVLAAQLNVTGSIDTMSNLALSSFATLQNNSRDLDASSLLQLGDSLVETYLDTIS